MKILPDFSWEFEKSQNRERKRVAKEGEPREGERGGYKEGLVEANRV